MSRPLPIEKQLLRDVIVESLRESKEPLTSSEA